jgi:CelD/BcsL family acetyltransferase involved in cellulose biosynthesis
MIAEIMTMPAEALPPCIVLDSTAALSGLRDELALLAERPDAASGIVQHPDWLMFELLSRGANALPYIVVARDHDGRVLGYAPFLVERQQARVAFGSMHVPIYRGRTLRLLGSSVVASPRDRARVEDAIARALRQDRNARVLRIQETVLPNTLAAALSADGFTVVEANLLAQVNWTIQPQASFATYMAGMDSKRRNDLTRRSRSVYKKLGEGASLRIFDAAGDMDEYCALMNQVYARSWHASTVAIDWALPARRDLFARLARSHRVIGHILMLGDVPIAYVHGYRLGGRYVLDDTGYDEAFAALGVGSSLVFQAIQDLIERYPGETIDFGYGDNQYKRVLATRQLPCGSLYAVRGMAVGLRFRMIGPLRWAYRRLRRMHGKTSGR